MAKLDMATVLATPEEEDVSYDADLEATMEEFIAAVKAGDAAGAATAFKAAHSICASEV